MIQRLSDFSGAAFRLGPTLFDRWMIGWAETKNLRVRLGLARHHPGRVYRLNTRYGPLFFRDNFGDITNLANIFYRQAYPILELANPGIILDAGANIGLAAAWFMAHNPGRMIVCFEPLRGNVGMVMRNCPSARVIQTALGAATGEVCLQVDPAAVMASTLGREMPTQELVFPMIRLDDAPGLDPETEIALLKIDVEGMELEVLQGATATLTRTHQVILETHGQERHNSVSELLTQAGFHLAIDQFNGRTGMILAGRGG